MGFHDVFPIGTACHFGFPYFNLKAWEFVQDHLLLEKIPDVLDPARSCTNSSFQINVDLPFAAGYSHGYSHDLPRNPWGDLGSMTVLPRGLQQKRVCWPEDAGAIRDAPGKMGWRETPWGRWRFSQPRVDEEPWRLLRRVLPK